MTNFFLRHYKIFLCQICKTYLCEIWKTYLCEIWKHICVNNDKFLSQTPWIADKSLSAEENDLSRPARSNFKVLLLPFWPLFGATLEFYFCLLGLFRPLFRATLERKNSKFYFCLFGHFSFCDIIQLQEYVPSYFS